MSEKKDKEVLIVKMETVPGSPLSELAGGVLLHVALGSGECEGQLVMNEVKIRWEEQTYEFGGLRRWYVPLVKEIPIDRTIQ